MKRIVILFAFCFLISATALAQRFAYVDTEYILKHIPEYVSAQKQIDALSAQWQKENETRLADVEKLYKAYQSEQVLLTEEMRRRRENEIIEKEKAAKDFVALKFAPDGDLFREKTRLIKPIQDRVAKAIQAVAENGQLDLIFDKNSEVMVLYASPRLDKSNEVVTRLGYKPGTFIESNK